MNTLQNCNCTIAPILRYINDEIFNGNYCINLNQFNNIDQTKLTTCLTKHGFKGEFSFINKELHYVYFKF